MHRLVRNYSLSQVSWNFEICGSSHVTIFLETKHIARRVTPQKYQIVTDLIAYLYTSSDETAC